MDFVEAMRNVKAGKRVRRQAWANKKADVMMFKGNVSVWDEKDGLYHPWMISEADVYAQDWEVIFDA